jgi:hypothetical protein
MRVKSWHTLLLTRQVTLPRLTPQRSHRLALARLAMLCVVLPRCMRQIPPRGADCDETCRWRCQLLVSCCVQIRAMSAATLRRLMLNCVRDAIVGAEDVKSIRKTVFPHLCMSSAVASCQEFAVAIRLVRLTNLRMSASSPLLSFRSPWRPYRHLFLTTWEHTFCQLLESFDRGH